MKEYDFDLYRVAKQGKYGVIGTKVLPQFKEMDHIEVMNKVNSLPNRLIKYGLDFGFVTSYNALISIAIDEAN